MDLLIGSEIKEQKKFELVMLVRDNQGKPTGRTKTISSDSAQDLETFFIRNTVVVKKKKRAAAAKTSNEVTQAVKEADKYMSLKEQQKKQPNAQENIR